MRAVLLKGFGGVEQLELSEVPDPKPGPGEVRVRVRATSVNPVDWKIRSGTFRSGAQALPEILGRDVAGEVLELGSGVRAFRTGDRVMGLVQHAYAEQVIARADALAPIPDGLDFEHAAELPLILLTGAKLIDEGVQPRPGETVLVTGAVGSVGRTAVHLAKQAGAKVLAGVRRRQLAEAESLGAERAVAIDDDAGIRSLPQLDAIADTVGGRTIESLLPAVRQGGRIGSVVGEPRGAAERGIVVHAVFAQPDARKLRALAEAVARGELKIPIARTLPLSQIREAHRLAESGGVAGKVVLTV